MEQSLKSDWTEILLAYESGWAERGIEDNKNFNFRIKANVENTVSYINEVITYFTKLKLAVNGAFIKIERANSLSVIITVPLNTFIDEGLLKIYSFINDIERHSRSDDYRVAFSITYNDGDLDSDSLISDGYFDLIRSPNG